MLCLQSLSIGASFLWAARRTFLVADRRRSIPLRARTAKRFITSSKSKPDLRRCFKMLRAVFAAALCLAVKATLSSNTSSYEKRVGSKSRDAYGLCAA
jgi:hypothetical protein